MDPATPSTPRPPHARRRRWLRRLVVTFVVAVGVGAVAYVFGLPWLVREKVAAALESAGLTNARFDVRRASLWGTTLGDVSAGAGAVRVESIEVTYRPLAVIRGELERVVVRGADVRMAIKDGKPQLPVNIGSQSPESSATGLRLPFAVLEVVSSSFTVDWDGQTLRLPLDAVVENKGVNTLVARVTVRTESPAGQIDLPGGAKLRGPSGVLNVDATIDATVSPAAGGGLAWRAAARVANEGTVMLTAPAIDANLGRVVAAGTVSGQTGASPSMDATLTVEGAALKHGASKLSLAGIALEVPVSVNARTPARAGTFSVASVMMDNEKLEPASGTIAVQDRRAGFTLQWVALPDALLSVAGWLSQHEDGVAGEITASVPPFKLDDGMALARRIPVLGGWDVTGRLGGDAKLGIENGRPTGRVTLVAGGADVASKDVGVELKGVDGTVSLDIGPNGISTPRPAQRLTAARAAFGAIELTDASLAALLEASDLLVIEQLSAGWLGGRVSTRNVRLNPTEPKFEATLVADRLRLRELLALAAEGRARGEGLMSGRIAVKVNGSQVSFGKGFLRSQSPTGELQVLDTQWLSATIDQSDPRFTTDRELMEVKQRILRALTDFEYDRLTFELAEEPKSRGLLRVSSHGKGRAGPQPQELDLTLNVRGVNDLLKYGLQGKKRYDELTNPGR